MALVWLCSFDFVSTTLVSLRSRINVFSQFCRASSSANYFAGYSGYPVIISLNKYLQRLSVGSHALRLYIQDLTFKSFCTVCLQNFFLFGLFLVFLTRIPNTSSRGRSVKVCGRHLPNQIENTAKARKQTSSRAKTRLLITQIRTT